MRKIITSTIVALSLPTFAAAQGGNVCMAAADMKASLIDWYQERPAAGQKGLKEQLWVSGRSGTWTKVKFLADGNACVIAQGTNWAAGVPSDALLASAD